MNNIPDDLQIAFDNDMTVKCTYGTKTVKFVFELGPESNPKLIYLYPEPLADPNISEEAKASLFSQAASYVRSCGYNVVEG